MNTCRRSRLLVRVGLLLASAVTFCSCRATAPQSDRSMLPSQAMVPEQITRGRGIEEQAEWSANVPRECIAENGVPIPQHALVPWVPPGIAGPWPRDEYLYDGGDRDVQTNLGPEGQLQGLELEDTVIVFDTIDGRTLIEPSNRVCLYAPRFAAVRKVTSLFENNQYDQLVGTRLPVKPHENLEDQRATAAMLPVQPVGETGTKRANIERVGEAAMPSISRQPVAEIDGGLATYADFTVMRTGEFLGTERARLIEAVDAAITWSADQAVQVVLEGILAHDVSRDQKAQATFRVETPNNPCLRLIKVASTKVARPGDIVEFTIRFDNQGDTELRNVVLVDNLTTRLEYVPDSAQCSRGALFSSEVNEGESLVLKWELTEVLPLGQGGLVHFRCRVR